MIELEEAMSSQDRFNANLDANLHVFEGCGNMLGVVSLTAAGYEGDRDSWVTDEGLRRKLVEWGKKIHSDSVMVLTGDPLKADEQGGYHVTMDVLEPNGGNGSDLGGLSRMCGNGVRAVAAYVKESLPDVQEVVVKARSGLRRIKIERGSNGEDLFVVDMGELTTRSQDLSGYIASLKKGEIDKLRPEEKKERLAARRLIPNLEGRYIGNKIPEDVRERLAALGIDVRSWSIGLNGDRDDSGKIDGEPHLVIEIPRDQVKDIADLRRIAVEAGPIITKDLDLFPEEMNANFIVREKDEEGKDFVDEQGRLVIWNVTHERNLGNDPDHSVTAACGTGSTVAGGLMFGKYPESPFQTVLVKCTGGDLEIAKGRTGFLMKGPAQRVK